MAKSQPRHGIPVQLSDAQFDEFVLPHLTRGHRGPMPKLPLRKIFNYILKLLYLGCQWKTLPIDKDQAGRPEIHPTSVYRIFRRWTADGCLDAILLGSVCKLHKDQLLDTSVIHGDARQRWRKKGATTSASAATKTSRATRPSLSA